MSGSLKKRDVLISQTINDIGITMDTEAVEVIRCKDCSDWTEGHLCKHFNRITGAYDFCSNGRERR